MKPVTNATMLPILLIGGLLLVLLGALLALALRCQSEVKQLNRQLKEQAADLEQQVQKAQAAAKAKSDFLSRMSHEIRTPLNAIIGMAQIAQTTSDEQKLAECMGKVESSSKHLLGIINDILDFSKIESEGLVLEEKLFSLHHNIDFITSMFKDKIQEKSLTFRVELESIEHDGIVTDTLRLNQVLINLISNAIKFTEPGGAIVLRVEEQAHMNGESVYGFAVRDTGVGIEPEQAKKLFTPFTQANAGITRIYGGTGLGLSISQSIVGMMGGEIELDTQPGQGSEFRFTIRVPAEEQAALPEQSPPPAAPETLQGKRILVVDDMEINREIVAALLEGSGALIEMAVNGKEALDFFLASEPHGYDMVLMDMLMPVMDGCAATMEIRGCGRPDAGKTPIVAMTANVMPEDMERAYQSGMNGFLAKPLELDVLYATLEEWL